MASNLLKRIASSLGIASLTGVIIFLLPNWTFCILVGAFIGIAIYEFFSIIESKGLFVYKHFGVIAGVIIPVTIYLHLGEGFANVEPFSMVLACLFTFILQLRRKEDSRDRLTSVALTLFALFYISWFFSFLIKIKYLPEGARLVSFLILVTKTGDVGAYFIGRKFGKSPLIPHISPKKTKQGALGGLLASVLVALACKFFLVDFSYPHIFLLGFLLGILGQIGDLAESLFKRDFGAKDSGGNLPGLGGVLDVIDSLLFTTPIFYFYVKILMPAL